MTEGQRQRKAKPEPETRDKETASLKRQSDEEFHNSGETDHTW